MFDSKRLKLKAEFRFKMRDSEVIYNALKVDGDGNRSKAKLYLAKDEILLTIEAVDLTALRASINAWVRLIKVCDEIIDLIEVSV